MGLVLISTFFEFLITFLALWLFESGFVRKLISFFLWLTLLSLMIGKQFWIQESSGGAITVVNVTYPTSIVLPFVALASSMMVITLYSMILDVFTWNKQKQKILRGETRNV
jgi:hypothetical protein